MKLMIVVSLISATAAIKDEYIDVKSLKGFQVFRIFPENDDDISFIKALENRPYYEFWSEVRKDHTVEIMTPPQFVHELVKDLESRGISFKVVIPDIDALIQMEKNPAKNVANRYAQNPNHPMTWDKYHSLEDMDDYLDYLEANYNFVSTEVIGKTYEGRTMRVVKICKCRCGRKKAVWIDGGIHAREWITHATVTWMLRELVENHKAHHDLLKYLDWYILPVVNPDGYVYTRLTDGTRMWRKNRSNHGSARGCMGVDLNRNWGVHFGEGGSPDDKCEDAYRGPEAFSETETRNVRDFICARKEKLVFYNTIHSYSQFIILPSSYTKKKPNDYGYMYDLAMKGSDALTKVNGKHYKVGTAPSLDMGLIGGTSLDWAHECAGINFTTTMELRDKLGGKYGFILPPDQIIPTAKEVWAFHKTVLREIIHQHHSRRRHDRMAIIEKKSSKRNRCKSSKSAFSNRALYICCK